MYKNKKDQPYSKYYSSGFHVLILKVSSKSFMNLEIRVCHDMTVCNVTQNIQNNILVLT